MLRMARKNATHFLKTVQKYRACHAKRLSTRHETCWNVTKCHARDAKRSQATLETYKNAPFCRTYHRHGHSDLARTVADGCGRLQTVADGSPCYAFGKNTEKHQPGFVIFCCHYQLDGGFYLHICAEFQLKTFQENTVQLVLNCRFCGALLVAPVSFPPSSYHENSIAACFDAWKRVVTNKALNLDSYLFRKTSGTW